MSIGDLETVKSLLNISNLEEDNNCCRPIHYACKGGHVEVVKLLLDNVELEDIDITIDQLNILFFMDIWE